jgi:molecular chaperone GrpE
MPPETLTSRTKMTDQKNPEHEPNDAPKRDSGAHESSITSEASPNSSINEPEPFTEIENLIRTEREVADAKSYGVTSFARDMLTFGDNLRRAIESVSAEERDAASPALLSFVEGIELTERDFLSRLARHGVKKIDPQGQKFDPNMHEALFEVPDPSAIAGTVLQVVESGYAIGDRCLRPAKVGVAKGGPKASTNGEAAN